MHTLFFFFSVGFFSDIRKVIRRRINRFTDILVNNVQYSGARGILDRLNTNLEVVVGRSVGQIEENVEPIWNYHFLFAGSLKCTVITCELSTKL